MWSKEQLLDGAEVVDAWRIFPRIYTGVFLWLLVDVHLWYSRLEVAPYPQWYVAGVWAALTAITKFYIDSGRKWGDK